MEPNKYRQTQDVEYTLLAYRKAKEEGAHDFARRIRWANPAIDTKEFNLIDNQVALIPIDRPEGWDS